MAKERGAAGAAGPLRFRVVDGNYLLTTDWGAWAMLSASDFEAFVDGRLEPGNDLHAELEDKGFVKGSQAASFEAAAGRLDRRRASVGWGPHAHLVSVTRAPKEGEASGAGDMSVETAERCVDVIFRSTSPRLRIVFQGPGALRNHAAIQQVVVEAEKRNQDVQKELTFELWSDLAELSDERAAWLMEHRFHVRAIVGAEVLEDGDAAMRGHLSRFVSAYAEGQGASEAPTVGVVVPCDRTFLGRTEAILRLCQETGCDELHLLPPAPEPIGLPEGEAPTLAEWLAFYEETLDAVVAAKLSGGRLAEHGARLFAERILGEDDPHAIELRSPATDGIGQLSYASDGTICTSDGGRALYERGDSTFCVGTAGVESYREIMSHPTVRAVSVATLLEGQPGCTDCAYLPYCGQSPAHNYAEQGSIQGRMADSSWCERVTALWDLVFTRLRGGDQATREVLEAWGRPERDTATRP